MVDPKGNECSVLTPEGKIEKGTLATPERVEAMETMFLKYHKVPLFKLQEKETKKIKDEL